MDWAPRVVRAKTTFQGLSRTSLEGYRYAVTTTDDVLRKRMFSRSFTDDLDGYHASEVFRRYVEGKEFEDNLRMAQYLDFKTYLPGDILTKVDRASMAHSLEVRVPFLDYTFVEDTARISTDLKLRGFEGKLVLKRALEPYLPREVLYRSKMGFAVPLDIWFRDSLKERIASVVNGPRLKESGYFDPDVLDEIVRHHQSGKRDYSTPLWSLLMFDGFLAAEEAGISDAPEIKLSGTV
jgi:asparagine synthase (glutamine-hydrolysing)